MAYDHHSLDSSSLCELYQTIIKLHRLFSTTLPCGLKNSPRHTSYATLSALSQSLTELWTVEDRFARPDRRELPPEMHLASPYSNTLHHLWDFAGTPNSYYALTRIHTKISDPTHSLRGRRGRYWMWWNSSSKYKMSWSYPTLFFIV
jgi:hypothetical protein